MRRFRLSPPPTDSQDRPLERVDAALEYARLGYPVLPLEVGGKRPLTGLVPHGLKEATTDPATIRGWFEAAPHANIGILPPPEVLVLDVDDPERWPGLVAEYPDLEDAPRQRTPRGGMHVFLRLPQEAVGRITATVRRIPGVDVRGMGKAYLVAAPSAVDGRPYRWEVPLVEASRLPLVPDALLARLLPPPPPPPQPPPELRPVWGMGGDVLRRRLEGLLAWACDRVATAPEGTRHNTLLSHARLIGGYLHLGLSEEEALEALANAAMRAGLPQGEAWTTARDGLRYGAFAPLELEDRPGAHVPSEAVHEAVEEEKAPRRESAAKEAVDLALGAGLKLWHTPSREAWATVPLGGHVEHHPIRGASFRYWLAGLFYREKGRALHAQALQDALAVLEAKAVYEGEESPVHLRLAEHKGKVYLDLARPDWKVVEIDAEGWRIIEAREAPVRFARGKHQRPLPIPEKGGSLDPFLELLPLRGKRDRALVLGWLVGALSPRGPYPILLLSGPKGAGKSTVARMLKELVDPQEAPLRAEPRDVEALMVGARGSWVLAFDNLSNVPTWLSDGLCRLSTGGGLGKRELYTDADEYVLEAQRPVVLTGIALGPLRDDLADRVARINLERLEDADRRPEREIWEAFSQVHPKALGALLDAVSLALRRWAEVRQSLQVLPRLADWAIWAEAAAPALGLVEGETVTAFYEVQAELGSDLVEADPVAQAILHLTAGWIEGERREYTATELLEALEEAVGLKEAKVKPQGWPRSAAGLGKHLPRLQVALRAEGVELRPIRDAHVKRTLWALEKLADQPPQLPQPPQGPSRTLLMAAGDAAGDAGDGERTPAKPPQEKNTSGTGLAGDAGDAGDVPPTFLKREAGEGVNPDQWEWGVEL